MAIKAQAPIVPVAIQGGRAAMRKGSWIIRPVDGDDRRWPTSRNRRHGRRRQRRLIQVMRARIEGQLQKMADGETAM